MPFAPALRGNSTPPHGSAPWARGGHEPDVIPQPGGERHVPNRRQATTSDRMTWTYNTWHRGEWAAESRAGCGFFWAAAVASSRVV